MYKGESVAKIERIEGLFTVSSWKGDINQGSSMCYHNLHDVVLQNSKDNMWWGKCKNGKFLVGTKEWGKEDTLGKLDEFNK